MANPEWKILDHRWNNFKRWFENMEERKDEKPYVTMEAMRGMIDFCDTIDDKLCDASPLIRMMAKGDES